VTLSDALKYVIIAGISVAMFFALAAAFLPTFAEEGATIATVILGFFGSMVAAIVVATGGQAAYTRARRDQKESEKNGGEHDVE